MPGFGGPNWERFAIKLEKKAITLNWLRAEWYCAELSLQILLIDSAQYDTVRNLTPRSLILGEDSEKFEYLGENESKNENILTHWSVAQADSNDEKAGGRKS